MPYSQSFPLGGNGDILQDLLRRVDILEARTRTLQNGSLVIQDLSGNQEAILGQLDSAGTLFGIQAGGVTLDANGLTITTGSGQVTVDGTGLHVYNASNQEEVRAGVISSSPAIYGLEVRGPGGVLQQVAGMEAAGPGSLTTSSTTPVAVASTSVTGEVGPSGMAWVTLLGVGEMNGPASAGGNAYFAIGTDGAAPGTFWSELQTNLTSAQMTAPVNVARLLTGLSAGSHTFQSYLWSDSSSHTVLLSNCYTVVQPL